MDPDKIPPDEANDLESSIQTHGVLPGDVLCRRFLIEGDLSDPAAAGCKTYLAKDLELSCKKVIVRTLMPRVADDGKPSNTFQEICGVLIKLGHPNIETILETGRLFDGRGYAVAAQANSHPLTRILGGNRRLVLERAAQIVESVAAALAAAHSQKILHCDVTPANIMVTPDQTDDQSIRLAGFGCAWPFPHRSDISDIPPGRESFSYAAPELLTVGSRATPASDIYSLAAVTWRMLTGEVPFKADSRDELLRLIVNGLRIRPSETRTDLPADAEAILLSALQYKAVMRPRDAQVFGHDLAEALRSGECVRPDREVIAPLPAGPVVEVNFEPASLIVKEQPRNEPLKATAAKQMAVKPAAVSERSMVMLIIILLLTGALSIPIVRAIRNEEQKPSPVSSIAKKPAEVRLPREMKYSIDRQIVKNATGDEYQLTFESDSPGNAYVFSEFDDEQGKTVYNVLYPVAKANSGSARIESKQQIRTRPAGFGDNGAPAIIWLVWTAATLDQIEEIRNAALAGDGIVRAEGDLQKLRHFLERHKSNRLTVRKDEAERRTIVSGSGDRIVHRIEVRGE